MVEFTPPENDDGFAIRLKNLDKVYRRKNQPNGKHALKNMTLDIPRGCIFGLLGPNGAGKSTIINILAGTVVKTSGTASVWGVDIDLNPRQARANIGIVPQELNIDAYFTPRETLDMVSGMFGVPKSERRVDEILEEIGLTEQAHSYARTLSGGMRRRLLVGKAMVHQPPILILDEPTAGVDVALRQKLWEMIRALNLAGVTIVLTTHYLEEAETLCDRIAIINHGALTAVASTKDMLKGAGSKTLVLTLRDAPDTSPKVFKNLATSIHGNQLKITYAPSTITAGYLLSLVNSAGLDIIDIMTEEPSLEDVFLALTNDN
ncbi:MAG: ABC transporter ATP-binding protein [Candidatus Puniceispirillales bacterium WSBS_2018_MAG_OTU23]